MIKFEIHELEHFIASINPIALNGTSPSVTDIQGWNDWIAKEAHQVTKAFQTQVHLLKPKPAERYIQANHLDLLRFMDVVEEYNHHPVLQNNPLLTELYQNLQFSLEKILSHLLKYYTQYIDQDLPLPTSFLQNAKSIIDFNFQQLKQLYFRENLEKDLLDVAFRPLNEFLKRNHNPYSYRTLLYFQEFINEWLPLLDMSDKNDLNWQIHYKLYYLNFNNVEYRIFCTDRLHDKLEALPSLTDRVEKVNWYVSTLRRLHQKPDMNLLPGQPSIVHQVLSVIEEEYQYLIDKETLLTQSSFPDESHNATTLQVPLTSLQLAQLANALDTIRFFPEAKPKDIIRFFAAHFSTAGQRSISENSFHTQFYSKNAAVLQSILEIIEWLEKLTTVLKTRVKQTNFNELQ